MTWNWSGPKIDNITSKSFSTSFQVFQNPHEKLSLDLHFHEYVVEKIMVLEVVQSYAGCNCIYIFKVGFNYEWINEENDYYVY